jgi:hypothetical protein
LVIVSAAGAEVLRLNGAMAKLDVPALVALAFTTVIVT